MSEAGRSTTRGNQGFLIVMGLVFIAVMTIPFACSENGGCRLAVVTPWSAFTWPEQAAIAIFAYAGFVMILQGLGLRAAGNIAGFGLLLLFGVMLNALMFGVRAPACGLIIGGMRTLAEIPPYPACAFWPTLTALWIDAFFIGFMLEVVRKELLPEAIRNRLKRWTQGLLLLSLSPMLLLLFALLIPTIGSEILKERWKRWMSR